MSGKRKITAAERKHQDYLRRKGLQVAAVYEARLRRERRKELQRVLNLCRDHDDPSVVAELLQDGLSEAGYLGDWWQGLWIGAGVPMAKSTARDMKIAKAAGDDSEDYWMSTLKRYAQQRAGSNIVIVSGSWKNSLVTLTRALIEEDPTIGIEKLTEKIYKGYLGTLEKWQCRRIAQTEAMIGMAEAADVSAKTLDVRYTKQWCISGLGNTRASHELEDGVEVDEGEPFSLPGGMLMYPHDTSMEADASEIINCACSCIRRPK